jgi:hypothetical protein
MANLKTIYGLEITPGWQAKVELQKNSAGELVISKLTLEAIDKEASNQGLTLNVLRSIKIRELINNAIDDNEYTNYLLIADSPYEWAIETRKQWLKDASGEWPRMGRKPHDISLYAKTAFFYVAELRINPTSPMQTLSEKLKIDKPTLSRRIDSARKLELLTRPVSSEGPAGKPGGALTRKAMKLLDLAED